MRSMGKVRARATERMCVSTYPPHPASPPKGERSMRVLIVLSRVAGEEGAPCEAWGR